MYDWTFEETNSFEGFNNAAADHFKGQRTVSIVRESIQNAIDAKCPSSDIVRVDFTIQKLPEADATPAYQLLPVLSQILAEVDSSTADRNQDVVDFFQNAVDSLSKHGPINLFAIHDSGTTGLTGPINRAKDEFDNGSNWYACVKSEGLTVGKGADSGGAFGHGKNATMSFSMLSTVFYATQITFPGGDRELRFQGKTSLISRSTPNETEYSKEYFSRTGYFGQTDSRQSPMLNSDSPKWAFAFRESQQLGDGTSIFVPLPFTDSDKDDSKNLWRDIKLAVLSNFYMAIDRGILEVKLNNEELINRASLRTCFEEFYENVENQFEDADDARGMLTSALTLHSPTPGLAGVENSPEFGEFIWALRIDENSNPPLEKTVGFARTTGMLITRDPQDNLRRFGNNVKPFDLFIGVSNKNGSSLLKRIENPAHNKFEFDRIPNPEIRKELRRKFQSFTEQIRKLVLKHAQIVADSEREDGALASFFSTESDFQNGDRELSPMLVVGKKTTPKPQLSATTSEIQDEDAASGAGIAGGDGESKSGGGPNDGSTGAGKGKSPSQKIGPIQSSRAFRIPDTQKAKILVTPTFSGDYKLKLSKVGDSLTEYFQFTDENGIKGEELDLGSLKAGQTYTQVVELDIDDFNYAVQPILIESSPNAAQ